MPEITKKEMKTLLKAQQGELDAVVMYRMLSGTVKDQADEKRHGDTIMSLLDHA